MCEREIGRVPKRERERESKCERDNERERVGATD